MGPLEQIIHLLNFIAPAWGVALCCVLVARWSPRGWLPACEWALFKQIMVSGVLGSLVLVAGLVMGGADGKMTTYFALVFTCGSTQWLMCKAWRTD